MIYDSVDTLVVGDNPDTASVKNTVYRIVYPSREAPDLVKVLKGVLNDTVSVIGGGYGNGCLKCVEATVLTRPEFGGWQNEFVERLLYEGYKAVEVDAEQIATFFDGEVLK